MTASQRRPVDAMGRRLGLDAAAECHGEFEEDLDDLDVRGAKTRFTGDGDLADPDQATASMDGLTVKQTGDAGSIIAGRPPADYLGHPYLEWYSHANGGVVVELEPKQVEVIGTPIAAIESDPSGRSGPAHARLPGRRQPRDRRARGRGRWSRDQLRGPVHVLGRRWHADRRRGP